MTEKTLTNSDSIIERKRKLGIETETETGSSSSWSWTRTPSSISSSSTTTGSTTTPPTSATRTSSLTTNGLDSGNGDQPDQSVWESTDQSKHFLLKTTNNESQRTFSVKDRVAILEGAKKVANLPTKKNLTKIYRFGSTNTLELPSECSPLKKRKLNSSCASSSSMPVPKPSTLISTTSSRYQRSWRSLNQRHSVSHVSSCVPWAPGVTVTGSPPSWDPEPAP